MTHWTSLHHQALQRPLCAFVCLSVCSSASRLYRPAASAQGSALPASAAVSGQEVPPHAAQGPDAAAVTAARPQAQGARATEAAGTVGR